MNNIKNLKFKVLFLPKWYPDRNDPFNGDFIEKHVLAISKFCSCAVLYVGADPHLKHKKYDIEFPVNKGGQEVVNDMLTIKVYYKNRGLNFPGGRLIKFYRYLKATYKGIKIIQQQFKKPDIVHVNVLSRPGILALALKLFKGIPYVITEHWSGYLLADGSYKGFLRKLLTKIVVRHARAVITVSECLKEAMLTHGLKNKYFVIPNVVAIPPNLKKEKNHNNKHIILSVSRLDDRVKNFSQLLKAVKNVSLRKKKFELHIIGDGQDRNSLITLARQLNILDKKVFFHGFFHGTQPQQEVYGWMNKADFLITSSNFETFSIATAAAIVSGKPVITTRCGGVEDYVNEKVGILIDVQNQQQLEEAILYMLDNYAKYNIQEWKEYATKRFSAEIVGQQILKVYNTILT